jgi:ATP-binding cassette subfamily B protein
MLGGITKGMVTNLRQVENLALILDVAPDIKDVDGATDLAETVTCMASPGSGTICFNDVRFTYGSLQAGLHGVTFKISSGTEAALVGPSGCGKSTCMRLLLRFYDPSSGAITIGGKDIRCVTQSSLRSQMGLVPQETVLFNDTILYNVQFANPSATVSM